MTELEEYFLCGVLSAIVIIVSLLLLFAVLRKPKQNDHANTTVDNPSKSTEQKSNCTVHVADVRSSAMYRLIEIADELSTATKNYREWLIQIIAHESCTIEDFDKGEELSRKLITAIKKYNLMIDVRRGVQ